jgi:hypothetical protein
MILADKLVPSQLLRLKKDWCLQEFEPVYKMAIDNFPHFWNKKVRLQKSCSPMHAFQARSNVIITSCSVSYF